MKRIIQTLVALALAGVIGGGAVVGFGLYNVSARGGHWPGVSTVLHRTFLQSVKLRAPSADEVPADLKDPDRAALGAYHFSNGCAFCHAVPGEPRSATALSMNPQPPHITEAVAHWEPEQMFWIVREGVKMSGMPHWPAAGNEDEIWSVVAYLDSVADQRTGLPQIGADGAGCRDCHGESGQSNNGFIPRLDILTTDQIAAALTQYRAGTRSSGIMQEAAVGLSDAQITRLADIFGAEAFPPMPNVQEDTSGWSLATRGTDAVPACTACHGPGRAADAPIAPALAGQSEKYLANQLHLWRDGERGGGPRAELMQKAAQSLSDAEIAELAAWYAGQAASGLESR